MKEVFKNIYFHRFTRDTRALAGGLDSLQITDQSKRGCCKFHPRPKTKGFHHLLLQNRFFQPDSRRLFL